MQQQLIVSPESATYESLGEHIHFGEVFCPFCDKKIRIAGPKKGWGLAYAFDSCQHSEGAIQGAGNDITVLFRGKAALMTIKAIAVQEAIRHSNPETPESFRFVVKLTNGFTITAYASKKCAGQAAKRWNKYIVENLKSDEEVMAHFEKMRSENMYEWNYTFGDRPYSDFRGNE